MRRAFASAFAALLLCSAAAPSAFAHSAFLGSNPEPGTRLADSPRLVSLVFTEALSDRLSKATLVRVSDGRVAAGVRSTVSGTRLVLELVEPLERGAYRVQWHTVSTEDGHALEGSFSFGVGAAAVGSEHDVAQSPLARDGWLRVLARGAMYATLLLLAGALMLDVLLSRRGGSWLVPEALIAAAPTLDADRVQRRHRRLVVDIGLLAVAAAALSAVADAEDAAGGFSVRGVSDFLLFNVSGLGRVYSVGLLVVAAILAALRLRAAAVAALGAMGAVALSGHANAASPRALAVANDWVHLSATALWLGGIAVIVIVWGPLLRRSAQGDRLAVARHVLPRFGRVALPAFLVVVVTGLMSAIVELGDVRALWETDYGRVLMVKVDLVAFIAAASYRHALRLRPRLLSADAGPDVRVERRHWRLLTAQPLLGVGVVAAVALLVAFPLPPRQLGDADAAGAGAPPAAACTPCPLPSPRQDELAVADQGGSDVVAAWVRRAGDALVGTVRLYGLDDRPVSDQLVVLGGRQTSCGRGCARFLHRAPAPAVLTVRVVQKGRSYLARLPVRWRAGEEGRARRLVVRAQNVMRALASVREVERVSSVPGISAVTRYRLRAPNRMAYRTNRDVQSVVVGVKQWTRGQPDAPWQRSEFGGGLPFRTRSWFAWTTYARHAYVLGERREGRRRVAVVALMDPGTPAWWRLVIDLGTHRVLGGRLVTYGHFMTQRFFDFDRPLRIEPPGRTQRGG
jgi:copper transport protein